MTIKNINMLENVKFSSFSFEPENVSRAPLGVATYRLGNTSLQKVGLLQSQETTEETMPCYR
jgi:hypothetical protein